jgi:DNA segregation ATPase FtsK/SpoIIIE-like protein
MRVNHLSYSAIATFMNNQTDFYKKYIAGVWDDPRSPAFVVGSAFHEAMEEFYKGADIDVATEAGLTYIQNTSDYEIDYGKTGTREKMLKDYETLIRAYFDECDKFDEIVDVEKRIERKIGGVPMVAKIDLIVREASSGLWVRDHKTCAAYSDPEEENYNYLMQGNIYARMVEEEYKEPIAGVIFEEIKKTINRDGSPQIRKVVYSRDQIMAFSPVLDRISTNVFKYVNDDNAVFFPNVRDRIHGTDSMRVVSNMEEGFDKARVKHSTVAAPKFAPRNVTVDTAAEDGTNEDKILAKLAEFGIGGVIDEVIVGNSVTTYKIKPNRGVKMSKIASLDDDISLALGSKAVRVIAPIYGTTTVGVEVPNDQQTFPALPSTRGTDIPIGVDTYGQPVYDDIAKMPHMLVGGQTGSGKSVFLSNIMESLNCQIDVIDMKGIDFNHIAGINIITDKEPAIKAIKHLVKLMEDRYARGGGGARRVLVIDEYADLVMQTSNKEKALVAVKKGRKIEFREETRNTRQELEQNLCRLLQKGRAANINVIIATQRPSADIVSPIIKANCPVKACLRVATGKNSEIILDETGGERLLGKGDMLYLGSGMVKPVRVQCYAPKGGV